MYTLLTEWLPSSSWYEYPAHRMVSTFLRVCLPCSRDGSHLPQGMFTLLTGGVPPSPRYVCPVHKDGFHLPLGMYTLLPGWFPPSSGYVYHVHKTASTSLKYVYPVNRMASTSLGVCVPCSQNDP